jgi:hypothetical protein
LKKVIPVLLIGIGFILFMNYFQKEELNFEVDSTKFTVLDSKEEIDKQLERNLPGLVLANEYNLVQEYEKKIPIVKANRTLYIEKAWFHNDALFLEYSISLKPGDKNPSEVPSLDVMHLTFETKEGDPQTIPVRQMGDQTRFGQMGRGYVLDNRLYRAMLIYPDILDYESYHELASGIEINNIQLKDVNLKQDKPNDQKFAVEDITLDLTYNFTSGSILEKISINQEIELSNGDSIHLDEFHVGINYNSLYLDLESTNKEKLPRKIYFDIELPEDVEGNQFYNMYQQHSYPINYDAEGKPYIFLQPFITIPEDVALKINAVEYTGDDVVRFTVKKELIDWFFENEENSKALNEQEEIEIGKTNDFSFLFAGLHNNNGNLSLKIGVKSLRNEESPVDMYFTLNKDYNEQLERIEEDNPEYLMDFYHSNGPIIKITDGHGNEVMSNGMHIEQNSTMQYQNIMLYKELIQSTDKLDIEIFKIPYLEELNHEEEINIELTNKE